MVSWLVRLSPDRAVRVSTLAGDILVIALNSHSAFSTQICKWVPVNLMLGITLRWNSIPFRDILQATSCYRNRCKLPALWVSTLVCRLFLYEKKNAGYYFENFSCRSIHAQVFKICKLAK